MPLTPAKENPSGVGISAGETGETCRIHKEEQFFDHRV